MERSDGTVILTGDGRNKATIKGIFESNSYEVKEVLRKDLKKEVKKGCCIVVFDVETEREYRDGRYRHALIAEIKKIDPRIVIVCAVTGSLCFGKVCRYGYAEKMSDPHASLSMLRNGIEMAIDRAGKKCW